MFFKTLVIFVILINNATSQTIINKRYSMEDLKVLESEGEYIEFFRHIKDILPSKRKSEWREMVSRVAQNYLTSKQSSKNRIQNISEADFKQLEQIANNKVLLEDEFFNKKYDQVISNYFKDCFVFNKGNCELKVRSFLKRNPPSETLGLEIAKLLYQQKIKDDLINFVMPMAKSKIGEFYCDKSPMSDILIDQLYKKKDLYKQVNPDCLKVIAVKLNKVMIGESGQNSSTHIRHLTYQLLKKTDNLSLDAKQKYLIIQLLEGFNLDSQLTLETYKLLNQLSKDNEKREEVLLFLKKQIPLFGKVFIQKSKASKAIIKGLNRYIPEYIDAYASTCLNHLSGKETTVGGNPATYCHEFFARANQMKIIPISKINAYKKIMSY